MAHDVPGHPERPARIRALEAEMSAHGWFGAAREAAVEGSRDLLHAVHPEAHVAFVEDLCASGGGAVDADTYAVPGTYGAALRAAGAAARLVDALLGGEVAVGVSALLAASATAFTVLKWAGAAYLLWVGVKLLLARPTGESWGSRGSPSAYEEVRGQQPGLLTVFRGGFLTNVLNPKVAIFFLAFVPQFIAPGTEHKALAFVLLGTLFNVNSIAVNSGWALAAAWMARHGTVQRGMHWLDRAAGAMFIAFGLKLAFTDNPSSR